MFGAPCICILCIWHQPVPGNGEVNEEDAEQTRGGRCKHTPRRLEEGGVHGGDNVDDAVADDQVVDPGPLLLQDAEPGPQVDHKGDHGERNVCIKVNHRPFHIHLGFTVS